MSKTSDELRALADAIKRVTEESPIISVAGPIVRNCVEHLRAIARVHEINAHDR